MFRSTIFWIHLVSGVVTGLVVLMMSVTGVLLTYERQIIAWADSASYPAPSPGAQRLPLEDLVAAVKVQRPEFAPTTVVVRNEPDAAVTLSAGRNGTLLVDPYSGAAREQGARGLRDFFSAVTGWHRWFNVQGEGRATARMITGASNLAFLFLVLSGIYLWLPRIWKWAMFRARLLFNAKNPTAKARDFNWHHVFGIWSAIPLAVIVAAGAVISYPWASDLVYRAVGEQPPQRGGGGGGGGGGRGPGGPPGGAGGPGGQPQAAIEASGGAAAVNRLDYDALIARAAAQGEWRTLTLNIPADASAKTVRIGIDQGNGGQPYLRHTLTLDSSTGAVDTWTPFSSQTTGQQARSWMRFLHTGEALGIVGQTVAGLVSFTSILMVWTGFALAWRRLVQPLFRRRAAVTTRPEAA